MLQKLQLQWLTPYRYACLLSWHNYCLKKQLQAVAGRLVGLAFGTVSS